MYPTCTHSGRKSCCVRFVSALRSIVLEDYYLFRLITLNELEEPVPRLSESSLIRNGTPISRLQSEFHTRQVKTTVCSTQVLVTDGEHGRAPIPMEPFGQGLDRWVVIRPDSEECLSIIYRHFSINRTDCLCVLIQQVVGTGHSSRSMYSLYAEQSLQ
jgi:hypothetical protein